MIEYRNCIDIVNSEYSARVCRMECLYLFTNCKGMQGYLSAADPCSPVRTRMTLEISEMNILPSPI